MEEKETLTLLEKTLIEVAEAQQWMVGKRIWWDSVEWGSDSDTAPDIFRTAYTPTGIIRYEASFQENEDVIDDLEELFNPIERIDRRQISGKIAKGEIPHDEKLIVWHGLRMRDWKTSELSDEERARDYVVKLIFNPGLTERYVAGIIVPPEIIMPHDLEIEFNPKKLLNNGDPLYQFFKSLCDVVYDPDTERKHDSLSEEIKAYLRRGSTPAILRPRQGGPLMRQNYETDGHGHEATQPPRNIVFEQKGYPHTLQNLHDRYEVCDGEWLDRRDKRSYERIFDYITEFINNTTKSQ